MKCLEKIAEDTVSILIVSWIRKLTYPNITHGNSNQNQKLVVVDGQFFVESITKFSKNKGYSDEI